mmetsp:Transcript_6651/g.13498  ORF Transcript_6651/g.13498 Transcript_6651/m.13498 type:complete len:319 (-) Transcript_6651:284-1240(-)|eukprot:CAMPEP_0118942636 /NCGR_PEP_ID=MMETSP1169-20130426/36550_1 /TAXON_ID=36882 /ORGANISM="Pyramimonas obovata, Strain CCMP722" /LENGTH=318 /DNA_ID=CAMNT_0006887683 /DNA_START=146 /DNA_END=1102 /DNA_ORIENTATION=+
MSRCTPFSVGRTAIAGVTGVTTGKLPSHRRYTSHHRGAQQRRARLHVTSKLEDVRSRRRDPDRDLLQTLFTQSTARYGKVVEELVKEIPAYIPRLNPEAGSIEEAFMSVPDLETIPYKVLSKGQGYEIRQVEAYTVAEVTMDGKPFDFQASGKAFNALAEYLFGGNMESEAMAMTTPVVQIPQSSPSSRLEAQSSMQSARMVYGSQPAEGVATQWTMAFVMPQTGRTGALPTPKDRRVRLRTVEACTMAVAAFPGIPSDEEILSRGGKLRSALERNSAIRVMVPPDSPPQIAQYNPPFTLPFTRRNEIAFEVELLYKQ